MPHTQFWMAISADLGLVRLSAAALQGILREVKCEPEHAVMIELCVVEAVNNAIEHAYAQDPGGRVEIQLDFDADMLEIMVTDTGRAMSGGAIERARTALDAAPGELREGGYGLGLIVDIMANVAYRRVGNRNVFTMGIRLPRSSA
jgi:serine/threonine-protein kinase RsbW